MDKLTLTFAIDIDSKIGHMETGLYAMDTSTSKLLVSLGHWNLETRLTEDQITFIREYTRNSLVMNLKELKKDFDDLKPPIVEYGDEPLP